MGRATSANRVSGAARWLQYAAGLAIASASHAQSSDVEPALTPVEQGVGDISPLQTSLRTPSGDLQQDADFEQVYAGPDGKLYRVSGATYAQFDQSIYVSTGWGAAPVISPGTVFYIGTPPALRPHAPATPPQGSASAQTRVGLPISSRVDERVGAGADQDALAGVPDTPEVSDVGTMSHEPTRRSRLDEIARHARTRRSEGHSR
ncbi:MAG: hypothetical protein KDA20_01240 [Phycisphaerales bacterium]|nr:hypothetical protein [Phycisphaerales bacterium]